MKMSRKSVTSQKGKDAVESLRSTLKASELTHDLNRQNNGINPDTKSSKASDDVENEDYFLPSGALVPVSVVRSFYELSALNVEGKMMQFARLEGRVTLVVNVATGDEQANRELTQMNEFVSNYDSRGLSIIAFPCNQFGSREPWKDHEIPLCMQHVRPGRGFTPRFHLMSRCDVNGPRTHPVFEFLKQRLAGCSDEHAIRSLRGKLLPPRSPDINWNFEKFLVNHEGKPCRRFSSRKPMKAITGDIEELLRRANIAMQTAASRIGANKFVHYDPSQDRAYRSKSSQRGKNF